MRIPPIQEIIHWLEVGQGARALRITVGLLTLLAVLGWYDTYQVRNFSSPEAMELSQLARNIARGEGYTTRVIRPLSIQMVDDHLGVESRLSRAPHPDIVNPPLYPVLLAGWLRIAPVDYDISEGFWRYQPEKWITAFNQALFLLAVWLAYRLGRRLLGGEGGVVVALALLASEVLWRLSAAGLPTMLLLVLFVLLLDALSRLETAAREERHPGRSLLVWSGVAGLLIGGLALTRYALLALLVPVVVYQFLFLGRRAGGAVLLTCLLSSLVVAPWLVRNHAVSGTLFGVRSHAAYMDTLRFPEDRVERTLQPDLDIVQNTDLLRKAGEGLRQMASTDVLLLGGTWVGAFFLAGLLAQYGNPAVNRLRVFLFLSLAVLVVVQSVGRTYQSVRSPGLTSENLLLVLTPGVCLVGVAFFRWMVSRMQLPFPEFRHVLSTVLVLGAAVPLFIRVLPPRTIPVVYPPYYPPHLREAAQFLNPSELLMSDVPWATAWYGDRTSVWTTMDSRESFYAIHDQHQAVSGLMLSPLTTDAQFRRQILQSRDHEWSRIAVEVLLRTNLPPGFPLKQAWRRGTPDHLFLADRARWLEVRSRPEEPLTVPRPGE